MVCKNLASFLERPIKVAANIENDAHLSLHRRLFVPRDILNRFGAFFLVHYQCKIRDNR